MWSPAFIQLPCVIVGVVMQMKNLYVTSCRFPPASASYILLQFAQYGNILKHVVSNEGTDEWLFLTEILLSLIVCWCVFWCIQMSNSGNWMHIQYQSKLQARKALSKDGKVFGESIMIGVKPCIDKVFTCAHARNRNVCFSMRVLMCVCVCLRVW